MKPLGGHPNPPPPPFVQEGLSLELSKLYCQIDDFTDEEMTKVLKSLQNGNARDPEGYIDELFKYSGADVHNSITIMLYKMRKTKILTEYMGEHICYYCI